MCPMHYQRWRHHGSPLENLPKGRHAIKRPRRPRKQRRPEKQVEKPRFCSVENCDRSPYAKGLCSRHYSQEWKRKHIPGYRSHAERRATPQYQQRAAYRSYLAATASERQERRIERKKALARQKQAKLATSSTVQYLREQITWSDDPTPYQWRLSSFSPDGEEAETALWDWQAFRMADKTGDTNHPHLTAMMNSPCPTIQSLIDKALEGEAMHIGERAILASTLRRYQSL